MSSIAVSPNLRHPQDGSLGAFLTIAKNRSMRPPVSCGGNSEGIISISNHQNAVKAKPTSARLSSDAKRRSLSVAAKRSGGG